jgi:SecD/SecF fusion protein
LFRNLNIDFLSKRRIAYFTSVSLIVAGIAVLIIQGGFNYGVDFTGGRSYVAVFPTNVVSSELKVALTDDFENAGTEVKTYGGNNQLKITTSYLINDESTEADEKVQAALIKGISESTGLQFAEDQASLDAQHFTIGSTSKVGASIADDIKASSLEAVLFSFVAIFIYILIRFKRWQFSAGAVVSLIHDSLFVFAAFAYARMFGKVFEIDQVFIAAILTVIGYSINDTVIIFDRVRENLALRPHENVKDTFNQAINDTLSRTLITSFATLLTVFILLVFGGEVLRGFSFALFIGIIVGTYSSIYIAIPIVLDFGKLKVAPKGDS